MVKLEIGDVFRYAKPYSADTTQKDGSPNHFYVTNFPKGKLVLLESGINPIAVVKAKDGIRRPAILIRSSPHKIGSEETPWQDIFDVDNGHIRYYGDNKVPGRNPALANGNKSLLEAFETYHNIEKRKFSVPIIFYKTIKVNGKAKGYIEFNGFGMIRSVELVTQYDRKMKRAFSNYAYDFQVFSLTEDHEVFNWEWINSRRNEGVSLTDTLQYAPKSWIEWINNGRKSLEKCRRRVSKLLVHSASEQLPEKGSKEEKTLWAIYNYYASKKGRFEVVAATVAAKIIKDQIGQYTEGWLTPPGSDGGADFYGRMDVGYGFGKAKLIVLGQAKCEDPKSPTSGLHIARTVARLRRGWMGVFVTTSYFSKNAQTEIIEDEYPILLINGKKLAETLLKIVHDDGYTDVGALIQYLDSKYEQMIQIRKPNELLFE